MGTLPKAARAYILAIWALGILAAAGLVLASRRELRHDLWEWVLLLPLSVGIGCQKVTIGGRRNSGDAMTINLTFVAVFTCLLWIGPLGGLLAAVLGCLATCLTRREQPAYQIAFNVALAACETWAAASVLQVGAGGQPSGSGRWLLSIPVAGLSMFAVSSVGVGIVVALCTGTRPLQQIRAVLWAIPSYIAGPAVAAVGTLLFHEGGRGTSIGGMILFIVPMALLTFQAYRIYVSREDERRKRIEDLQASQDRLAELYLATIRSLALAIDAKDQYTHQHILRVQRYAMAIAAEIGLGGEELKGLETGALLHDIGKLGVPEYILLKPGKLTDDEFEKIKKHPEIGAAILDPVPFPWPVLPVVKYHHEKWDGTGYPEGLKGEEIPLTARILAVADVYDALTSSRSYRSAWTHERALAEIVRCAGTHFDPALTAAFERVVDAVIEEMAREGHGPLAKERYGLTPDNKAEAAAQDIKRASSELWALYEVAETLTNGRGLRESLEIFARKLASFRPGSTCVLVRNDERGEPFVFSACGPNRDFFLTVSVVSEQSPTARASKHGEAYLGAYVHDDLMVNAVSGEWTELSSALIVPIVHDGVPLGAINLYHGVENAFSEHDAQLLERIAERAAQAIFQGAVFDRTQSDALTDPLTGLHNVRYLNEQLAIQCRRELPFAVLCLDLDDFKPVNDTFGHRRGDDVLRELSVLLRGAVRGSDTVARCGGDEFAIVLEGADEAGARRAAHAVEESIRSYDSGLSDLHRGKFQIGVSVGYACYPVDGTDGAALLAVADTRMYGRKNARKGRYKRDRAA